VESVLSEVEVPLTGDDGVVDEFRDMHFEDKVSCCANVSTNIVSKVDVD
jgi:hypothetical protein